MFTFTYKNTALLNEADITKTASELKEYTERLRNIVEVGGYSEEECSINVPSDDVHTGAVKEVAERFAGDPLKYIVVIGIGGSNLGTMAIYEALFSRYDAGVERSPKLLFLDTSSTKTLEMIQTILDEGVTKPEELLLNVVTKSGGTAETISNFDVLEQFLRAKLGDITNRVVVTTNEDSKLWNAAGEKGIARLPIPEKVGGRYSVMTPVGLFPLMLAGVDVEQLLQGAVDMRTECLEHDIEKNPALTSAVLTYLYAEQGVRINNSFLFNPELESVGKWYRQLMGESVGKLHDREGNIVNSGITPIVSIGSTDLHSMAQLYLGGPKDKFATFVYAADSTNLMGVAKTPFFDGLVENIPGKRTTEIMDAIIEGVQKAYTNNNIPYVDMRLSEVSEYTIGQYLQFKMIEMMYLAKLLGVNAFDQPNVEDYKKETRKLLG